MAKLHEVLAVERDKQAVSNKLLTESLKTLKKDSLFKGQTRTLTHFSDEDRHLDITEHQNLETTVSENLQYIKPFWSEWIDVVATKDNANMSANADILVDGKKFATGVSAMTLLGLETKLNRLRDVLESIPTLPPGIAWTADEQERSGVYRSEHIVTTIKDVKDTEFRKVAEATESHPAQIAQVPVTKQTGKYETIQKCGMMTPLDKADHLARLDTLLHAVKKARARANEQKVENVSIGESIFDYVCGIA